jgi:hypothetical protein
MSVLDTQINRQAYIGQGIGDVMGATKSLKTAQQALPNYTLSAVLPNSGELYNSLNRTVGSAAFVEEFTFLKATTYHYDFATDGGAVGTINLRGPALPADAVVVGGRAIVTTAFTSGGSATLTAGTSSGAPANLLASIAVASLTTGSKALVPVMTAATDIVLAANSVPVAVIGTAAMTAGALKLIVFYMTAQRDTTVAT